MQYPYEDIINTKLLAVYFTDLKWQQSDENKLRGMYQKQRSGRRLGHQGTCLMGSPPAGLTRSPLSAQVLNYKSPEKSLATVLPFHKIKIKVESFSLMVVPALYLVEETV